MAYYVVDVRDRVIQRVAQKDMSAKAGRFCFIEAGSKKMAWAKAMRAADTANSADCDSCGHRYCPTCEECSLSQRYSDFWICHRCGALSPRTQGLH